jgi:hypothetical protein
MRAELVLMGRRVDMARQARRRTLVVLIYAAMLALMTGMWFVDHWRTTGTYVFWAALLACRLFLGGYYRGGLVKPFNNRIPRHVDRAPSFLALGLRVYNPLPEDDRSYLSDERELAQRDHAHYLAYQAITAAILVPWFLSYLRMLKPGWIQWPGVSGDQVFYGLTLMIFLLAFTLPQAILLWTEPDMAEVSD